MAERSWSFSGVFRGVFGGSETISDETWDDLEFALIGADFGPDLSESIIDELRAQVERHRVTDAKELRRMLRESIEDRLSAFDPTLELSERPAVVLVVGVNGVGKTTTIGKLANYLRSFDKRVLVGAADTFRAAAVEQLATWAERAGADIVKPQQQGQDPAAVAFQCVERAKAEGYDVALIDTAGRLQTKGGLMDELGKVRRVIEKQAPIAEVLLVLDATTGQNGLAQAEAFIEHAGVTGLVLTKLDGSAKGGFVLAVQQKTGLPIKLVGQGEGIGYLTGYTPHVFARQLVGSRRRGLRDSRLVATMATFGNLSQRLTDTFKNLRAKGRLSAADVDGTVREIRRALLEADVSLDVVKDFTAKVRERALGDEVNRALNPAQQVVQIVNEELVEILGGEQRRLQFAKKPPTVIMLAGLQGAGKTTFAGKLAKWLKDQGHTPLLVACDLQRPNAVTQLGVVAEQAGVTLFAPEPGNGVGDPVKVAKAGVKEAERKQHDFVIVDTAGRLGVDAELMKQAGDIRKAIDPDEVLFVINAMIGQDAVTTAKAFQEGVDFTGVVLTMLDGDARGGAALSIRGVTGRPILFASTGEGLTDFEPFHPDRMASRILDLGDILTLIEQTQQAFDEDEARQVAEKIATEQYTLDDFLKQMQQLRGQGSIKKMMGMLPGMGKMKEQLENFDEREIIRTEAIIQSMTKAERTNPKLLNGSRRLRIAKGSGTTVTEVNSLVTRFEQAAKMMKTVAKGGVPQVPGMGPIPGMGGGYAGKKKQQAKGKGAKRSGNPAKRAAEAAGAQPQGGGSGFGLGASTGAAATQPTEADLAQFQQMLGRGR